MVKEIPLTQGKVALVDDDDYENVMKFKWFAATNNEGKFVPARGKVMYYIKTRRFTTRALHLSRFIMGVYNNMVVDHINGDTLDNRRCNLRVCTTRQNLQNLVALHGKKASKYPGVSKVRDSTKNPWQARIRRSGDQKVVYLGVFPTEREAAVAYEKALREMTGQELICKMDRKKGSA